MINTIRNTRDYLKEVFGKPHPGEARFRYREILFFLRFAKPVWKLGLICMGLMFITSGISALLPLGRLIDPARYFLGSLNLMIITALILGIIAGITGLIQRYLTFKFQQESVFNMQTTLFDHLLSFPLTFFKKKQTGYLMSRVSDDINRIQMLFSYSIPQITSSLFYLLFGIVILFSLNVKLSLILICIIPFYVLLNYSFAGRLRSLSWNEMEKSAGVSGNFQEAISGIELIKSFAAEKRAVDKVSATLRNVMSTRMKHTILASISNYSMSGSRLMLTLLIVWLGIHEQSFILFLSCFSRSSPQCTG